MPPPRNPRKAPRVRAPKEKEAEVLRGGTVSLSVRVPFEIPDALVRGSADRKVKRQRPFTQQDITVEAVSQWLKKYGYL
jgi:hypothetical protein